MKNNLNGTIITALFLFIFNSNGYSQNGAIKKISMDTTDCLDLVLHVVDLQNQSFEGAKVKIYNGNEVLHSFDFEYAANFIITLKRNINYTVEISYPGYLPRRLSVNTHMPPQFRYSLVYRNRPLKYLP